MGVSQRAYNEKIKKRLFNPNLKIRKDDDMEPASMNNTQNICKSCGFKARYPFHRCPECEAVNE